MRRKGSNGQRLLNVGLVPLLIHCLNENEEQELVKKKRRTTCINAEILPNHYGFQNDSFHPHAIGIFVSFSNISHIDGAFIASLNKVTLPKCWQEAIAYQKWRATKHEELPALVKNRLWQIKPLPTRKKELGYR
uniref:Uncharacterized protein n=1 Tax=Kalanchoe fedtschenkoi TaxID=63787 RepID=A0A7N0ZSK3_KALFE